jgi:hypothetical protein
MPKRRRYRLRKRCFLEPLPSLQNSYISVVCESTENGVSPHGGNYVVIADCHRSVSLEFYMGNAEARRISLWKIDGLLDTIASMRTALYQENELIEQARKKAGNKGK